MASDRDLVVLYRWLEGVEAVRAPAAVTLALKRAQGEPAPTGVDVELTARATEARKPGSLHYRLTLALADNVVANQPIEYRRAADTKWAKVTTDERGEALLPAGEGLVLTDAQGTNKGVALRLPLKAGRYLLSAEAIDDTAPANPVVMGIGTLVLRVE